MNSVFHTDLDETVLFQQWKTTSIKDIALTCVAVFFLSAATEALRAVRMFLSSKYIEKVTQREASAYEMRAGSGNWQEIGETEGQGHRQKDFPESTTTEQSPSYGPSRDAPKDANDISKQDTDLSNINLTLSRDVTSVCRHAYSRTTRRWIHLLCSLLFLLQTVLSWLVMLVFMTFNVWLCLSVVVGFGVGYFCFATLRIHRP
ncbi:uncharacterized protein LOC135494737 [Lineus longissimus]|uniref:uncharacterized protein LOC135494737 n=1 Tax=Lineus longissimus TaxID=88925 RepID=UPI002B4D7DEC